MWSGIFPQDVKAGPDTKAIEMQVPALHAGSEAGRGPTSRNAEMWAPTVVGWTDVGRSAFRGRLADPSFVFLGSLISVE